MRKLTLIAIVMLCGLIQACNNSPNRNAEGATDTLASDVSGENRAHQADQPGGNDETSSGETAPGDITHKSGADDDSAAFIKEAGTGGLMEVAMGKIALARAGNPKVKAFAQQMVDDHGRANAELATIARKAGIIIPTDVIPEQRAHLEMLKKLSGTEFDKQYMKMMVQDHQKTVELFKSGQRVNKDDLVKFAQKNLKVIEDHYSLSKSILANIGG